MKKSVSKKLFLSKETLVRLNGPELGQAAGGGWSDDSICPTTTPSENRSCGLLRNNETAPR